MDLFTFLSAVASYLDETTGIVICRPIAERLRGQDLPVPPTCLTHACREVAWPYPPESEPTPLPDTTAETVGCQLLQTVQNLDPEHCDSPPGRAAWRDDQELQSTLAVVFTEFTISLTEAATKQTRTLLSVWGAYMTIPEAIKIVAASLRDRPDQQQKMLVCKLVLRAMQQAGLIVGARQVMMWGQTMLNPLHITTVWNALAGRPTAEQEGLLRHLQELTAEIDEPLEPEKFAAIVRRSVAN